MIKIWNRIWSDIKQYRWVIVAFILWNVVIRSTYHAFCPILIFFGVPCAGCGMTRAIWFCVTGQLERGMQLNPSALIWIVLLVYIMLMRYVLGRKMEGIYIGLGVAVGITFVVYIYRMLVVFPGSPPMVFHQKCILEQMFPGYIKMLKNIIG